MQLNQNAAIPFLGDPPHAQKNLAAEGGGAVSLGTAFADFVTRARSARPDDTLADVAKFAPPFEGEIASEDPPFSDEKEGAEDLAFAWIMISPPPPKQSSTEGMTLAAAPLPSEISDDGPSVATEIGAPERKTLVQSTGAGDVQEAVYADSKTTPRGVETPSDQAPVTDPSATPDLITAAANSMVAADQDEARDDGTSRKQRMEPHDHNWVSVAPVDSRRFQSPENAFGVLAARQANGVDFAEPKKSGTQESPRRPPLDATSQISMTMAELPLAAVPSLDTAATNAFPPHGEKRNASFSGTGNSVALQPLNAAHSIKVPSPAEPIDVAAPSLTEMTQKPGSEAEESTVVHSQANEMAVDAPQANATAMPPLISPASLMTEFLNSVSSVMMQAQKTGSSGNSRGENPSEIGSSPMATPITGVSNRPAYGQPSITAANLSKSFLAKAARADAELTVVKELPQGFPPGTGPETLKFGQPALVGMIEGAKLSPGNVVAQIGQQLHQRPEGTVEINLHPKELGKLHFEMVPKGEGMSVTISAEHPQTMEILRKGADQLLQELRNAGFVGSTITFDQWGQRPQQQTNRGATPGLDPEGDEGAGTTVGLQSSSSSGSGNSGSGRSLDLRL